MPYAIRKNGDEYCVYNKDTGDNKGCSETRAMAVKHMRALYANAGDSKAKDYHPDIYYINSYIRYCNELIEQAQYNLAYDAEHLELQDLSEDLITYLTEKLDQLILWRAEWYGTEDSVKDVDTMVTRIIDGIKGLINPPVSAKTTVELTKDVNGRTRVMMRVSNNFKDRHGEIITEAAHKAFVEYLDTHKEEMPEFWVWHIPGSRWGQADVMDFSDGFLTASGLVDEGKEWIAEKLVRKDFGVSHGFRSIKLGRDTIDWYKSFEFSPLPRESAANTFTNIIMEAGMDSTKRQKLLDIGLTEELLDAWDKDSKGVNERLKALGIEYKDDAEPEPTQDAPNDTEPKLGDVLDAVNKINERIDSLEAKQKSLEGNQAELIKEGVSSLLEAAIVPGQIKGHVATKDSDNKPQEDVVKTNNEWEDELTELLVGGQVIVATILEQLAKELGTYRQKDLPSGSPVGPYMHGPGGLFGVEGLEKPVISTRVAGSGIASALPARGTNITNPLYPYITGFLAPSGSNANGVCDDPQTAGPIKNCFQTADFGRYSFQSREVELNRVGQRINRGEFMDLELVNPLLAPQGGGILSPDSANNGGSQLLANEMRMRMVEVGVAFENALARQIYTGNPANNSAGGGYQEFPGLDILIGTTKVDAKTGTPCPSLRSDIKTFNYVNISSSGGGTIVNVLTYMMRMLQWNAERMNMGATTWAIVMRPTLFMELTAVWPCAYMTYRCPAQDNTQTQLVIDSNDQLAMRDAMRNGRYLLIDGVQYPVILDTGIVEENNSDNANIGITCFASDIYVVPLTTRNGTLACTFWEYFDYSAENAAMSAAQVGGWADSFFWTDGGRYLWHRKPPLNWCVQLLAKIEPRIILLTPHLAGRVTDVQYCPLQHERDAIIGDDYFVDGGVENRTPGTLYSDWNSTTPA